MSEAARETSRPTLTRQAVALVVLLILVALVARFGGYFTARSADDWYEALARPSWSPPGWLIGAIWTVLYVMMAVAAWLVWRDGAVRGVSAKVPLAVWGVQLALNAAWSPIFFGLRAPGWALVDLVALWVAIVATTVLFFRRTLWAGILFLPYVAWVSFAGVLNLRIWQLNA